MAACAADTENRAESQDLLQLAPLLGEIVRHRDAGRRLSLQGAEAIVTPYVRNQPVAREGTRKEGTTDARNAASMEPAVCP